MCNKVCNTCIEIYCPWRKDVGFKEFETVEELIQDLHEPE